MKNVIKLITIILLAGNIFLYCGVGYFKVYGEEVIDNGLHSDGGKEPHVGKGECKNVLGPNLTKVVKAALDVLRIAGAVIALINASLAILPAISNPDKIADAKKKCINMAIILVAIGLLPTLLRFIASIFGYSDSCF